MNLPENTGYVAAAYLVFLVLVLIYLAIMAIRLGRLEQQTGELLALAEKTDPATPSAAEPAEETAAPR